MGNAFGLLSLKLYNHFDYHLVRLHKTHRNRNNQQANEKINNEIYVFYMYTLNNGLLHSSKKKAKQKGQILKTSVGCY